MEVYFETEAQDRLKRIENGEDIQTICNEIIYEPYESKEILIYMISILIEKLKHFTSQMSKTVQITPCQDPTEQIVAALNQVRSEAGLPPIATPVQDEFDAMKQELEEMKQEQERAKESFKYAVFTLKEDYDQLEKDKDRLKNMNDMLDERNTELEETKLELEEQVAELQRKYESAQRINDIFMDITADLSMRNTPRPFIYFNKDDRTYYDKCIKAFRRLEKVLLIAYNQSGDNEVKLLIAAVLRIRIRPSTSIQMTQEFYSEMRALLNQIISQSNIQGLEEALHECDKAFEV